MGRVTVMTVMKVSGTYVRVVMMIRERMRSFFTQLTHIYSPTLVDPPPCPSLRLTPRVRFRVMVISSGQ